MNRNILLFMMLILLSVSVTDEGAAPTITVKGVDHSKYVISETEMPIYELVTPEVNESRTEQLARSLTPIPEISAEEADGRFVVTYLNQTFEMDRRDGSMWYADYDKLWNVALGIEVPTPESCRRTADAWLNEKGLLPDNAVFANIGSTNATFYNPDSERTLSKVLQYHVNYEFEIDDYPIAGETAQISVIIGEGGDTLGFNWKWREPKSEPYTTANLIEYESILEVYGISSDVVVDYGLIYTADDDSGKTLLSPAWEIEIIEDEGEEGISDKVLHFDATILDPQVEITQPSHQLSVMPGTSITFDCDVQFGTPPYTYQWRSDFDGDLSTAKSFTWTQLSELLKKDTPIPHAISVRVRDADDRGCSDCIAVYIETVDFTPDTTITLAIVASVTLVVGSLLLYRRKRGGFLLLLALMILSAFIFFPVSYASSESPTVRTILPSAPTGAYDDGKKEVGIEWVGMSDLDSPLWNTERNIEGFYNWIGAVGGFSKEFNWGEWSAWEKDFKDASNSGTDSEWVDAVDIVYYQDHGGAGGVCFTSHHDDGWLSPNHMRLGDGDLETIVFDACSPLRWENNDGDNVFEIWSQTMQGVHQICSFATSSRNVRTRGERFGTYMTGLPPFLPPMTIVQAWFRACLETEGSDKQAAVFYASKSPDPGNPQLDDPINDHAYGYGYVCSDPTPGTFSWYVYITSNC